MCSGAPMCFAMQSLQSWHVLEQEVALEVLWSTLAYTAWSVHGIQYTIILHRNSARTGSGRYSFT